MILTQMQEELYSLTFMRTIMCHGKTCLDKVENSSSEDLILLSPDCKDNLHFLSFCCFMYTWRWHFLHTAQQQCLLSLKREHDTVTRAWGQHPGHFKSSPTSTTDGSTRASESLSVKWGCLSSYLMWFSLFTSASQPAAFSSQSVVSYCCFISSLTLLYRFYVSLNYIESKIQKPC